MQAPRLYSVINESYRNTVKAALISNRYPLPQEDEVLINGLSVTDGLLKDAPFSQDTCIVGGCVVVGGDLTLAEFPKMLDTAAVTGISLTGGVLQTVVKTIPLQQEVNRPFVSGLSLTSGNLQVVVIATPLQQETDKPLVSGLSLISGTLA